MILIVGERRGRQVPFKRRMDPEHWYKMKCCEVEHPGCVRINGVGLRAGAFCDDSSGLQRLASLCPILGDENPQNVRSINLCYPGKEFDYHFADQVASLIRDDEEWGRVVLCGKRVAQCFGISSSDGYHWGELISGHYVVLPNPSERNKWWSREPNELERLLTIELAVRSLVDERHVIGVCRDEGCGQPLIALDSSSHLCPIHEAYNEQ